MMNTGGFTKPSKGESYKEPTNSKPNGFGQGGSHGANGVPGDSTRMTRAHEEARHSTLISKNPAANHNHEDIDISKAFK